MVDPTNGPDDDTVVHVAPSDDVCTSPVTEFTVIKFDPSQTMAVLEPLTPLGFVHVVPFVVRAGEQVLSVENASNTDGDCTKRMLEVDVALVPLNPLPAVQVVLLELE